MTINVTFKSANAQFNAADELAEMSRRYYLEADRLAAYREKLKQRRGERPSPEELHSLENRIDLLYDEIRDLRDTALSLKKLAAEKPRTPSLAARSRRNFS